MLRGDGIVATDMSNLGLERHLGGRGLKLIRTKVGDRYVLEHMRAHGYNVGGEQSGHIILLDHGTTGDGLVAALQVLCVIVSRQRRASEVTRQFEPVPQLLKSVRYDKANGATPLAHGAVERAIAGGKAQLGLGGRLVIRPSGTEPVIRVMAEGDDAALVRNVVDQVCSAIQQVAASPH
jgi:phosphoglucosamine mutase